MEELIISTVRRSILHPTRPTAAMAFVQILESRNHIFYCTSQTMGGAVNFSSPCWKGLGGHALGQRGPLLAHLEHPEKVLSILKKGHFGQHFIERAQCSITRVMMMMVMIWW